MVKYFNKWNLKCTFNRIKLMVFKKTGKPKNRESWYVSGEGLEAVKWFIYFEVKPGSSGDWRRHTESITVKGTCMKKK